MEYRSWRADGNFGWLDKAVSICSRLTKAQPDWLEISEG